MGFSTLTVRNRTRDHFARTFLGDRSSHKECAKQIPTALRRRRNELRHGLIARILEPIFRSVLAGSSKLVCCAAASKQCWCANIFRKL